MHEPHALLPWLEPPGGGLRRLQAAISEQPDSAPHRHRSRRLALIGTGLAMTMTVGATVLPGIWHRQQQSRAFTAAIAAALADPKQDIVVADGAALAIHSGRPDIRVYLVTTRVSAEPERAPTPSRR